MTKINVFPARSTLDTPVVAIVTICVVPQAVEQITRVVDDMPWAPVYENLDRYLGVTSRAHWSAHTKNATACVAIVDFDQNPSAALETVDFLHQTLPGRVSVIALATNQDQAMILKTMRAGCSEYLQNPLDAAHLAEALARIERRSSAAMSSASTTGRILSFFGAKGGVGTTTLAVHLAVCLATVHKKKTLLIDNHSELGHVCLYLGLEGAHYSFHELLRSVDRLDVDLLKGFVVKHSSGLDVIASAESHGGARNTDPAALQQALNFLREEYDYVVLDCSRSLEESNMTVVDHSDQIYLVSTPDIGAVRDLSRHIDGLIRYQQPTEKLGIIVNRSSSKGAMSTAQIEKVVRMSVSTNIPNSYAELAEATNMGVPVQAGGKSDFSEHLRAWSQEAAGGRPVMARSAGRKSLLFWK